MEPRHRISAGPYTAEISEVGAALHRLTHDGRELVLWDDTSAVPQPGYRGAVLVPWPNRLADGRYGFAGQTLEVPVNELARRTALHGLAAFTGWELDELDATAARLSHTVWPQPGYPFTVEVETDYVLDEDGLTVTVVAHNAGPDAAPYGVSIHPYLVAGAGRVDDWTLTLPAAQLVEVDAERLLPTRTVGVEGTPYDFRSGRRIGGLAVDNAYTGIEFTGDAASATVTAADGHGVRISWDLDCPWVQVHTADSAAGSLYRAGLALEPMTCAPDAFNSGAGLIVLQPGDRHLASWHLSAI